MGEVSSPVALIIGLSILSGYPLTSLSLLLTSNITWVKLVLMLNSKAIKALLLRALEYKLTKLSMPLRACSCLWIISLSIS